MSRGNKIALAIGGVAIVIVLVIVLGNGLRLQGQGDESVIAESGAEPAAAESVAAEAYLGPTETAPVEAESVSPEGDVINQWGQVIGVQGSDPFTLTLDTSNYGEMTFTILLAETDFYFTDTEGDYLPYTGDVFGLAQQVAGMHGDISIAYMGEPGQPERTLSVLFETDFDVGELEGAQPSYVKGGGDVTVDASGRTSTTGQIITTQFIRDWVELAINGNQLRLMIDARAAEPYEFEFDLGAVNFQVLRGLDPDFTYESIDPGGQARADLLADAEERGLDVTVATVGPPESEVFAILVQESTLTELISTTGLIETFSISGNDQVSLTLDASLFKFDAELYEFEFDVNAVDIRLVRGVDADITYESVDPGRQTRYDFFLDAMGGLFEVTIVTRGPPGKDVSSILVKESTTPRVTLVTGKIVELAISSDNQVGLTLDGRTIDALANELYEFEFDVDSVDFEVLRGADPDYTFEFVDPGGQARADLLSDAEERGLDVTISAVGLPPVADVSAIVVQDVIP